MNTEMIENMNGNTSNTIASQLEEFKRFDEVFRNASADREQGLMHVVSNYEHLLNTLIQKESHLTALQASVDNSAFILALIDGDNYHFHDAFLADGEDGGSDAAYHFHREVEKYIKNNHPSYIGLSVKAVIYMNLDGLAHHLAAELNIIKSPLELRAFAGGFTMFKAGFHIISVGQGKERVDHKIKQELPSYILNPSCKHIILGTCNDYGYRNTLREFKHDDAIRSRLTLLESAPALPDFNELKAFESTRFDKVFRYGPLPSKKPPSPPKVSAVPVAPPVQKPQIPAVAKSYTSVANTPGPKVISVAPTPTVDRRKYILLNPQHQRVDEPIKQLDSTTYKAAYASVQTLIREKKICTDYQLRGGVCTREYYEPCPFSHETKLLPAQLVALQKIARTKPCQMMHACKNPDCYFGHVCSNEASVGRCVYGDNCDLAHLHGKVTTAEFKQYEPFEGDLKRI